MSSVTSSSSTGSGITPVVSSPPHPLPIEFNITSWFQRPMDRSSYIFWKPQFEAALSILHLSYVISNKYTAPPKTLEDGSDNPDYDRWIRADLLVLCWIKATVSTSIHLTIIKCKSASAAWSLVEKQMALECQGYVHRLWKQLRSLKKTPDLAMTDYLIKIKSLSICLVQVGENVADSEVIDFVVDGLSAEYHPAITTFNCDSDNTFDRLYNILIRFEYVVKKSEIGCRAYSCGRRVICQICDKYDHSAKSCSQRFDF